MGRKKFFMSPAQFRTREDMDFLTVFGDLVVVDDFAVGQVHRVEKVSVAGPLLLVDKPYLFGRDTQAGLFEKFTHRCIPGVFVDRTAAATGDLEINRLSPDVLADANCALFAVDPDTACPVTTGNHVVRTVSFMLHNTLPGYVG